MPVASLEEGECNIYAVNNVDGIIKIIEILLAIRFRLTVSILGVRAFSQNLRKSEHKWDHEEVVNKTQLNKLIPDLNEDIIRLNQIPGRFSLQGALFEGRLNVVIRVFDNY